MSANKGFFNRFMNPVFIETGSGGGGGIQSAIDAGFPLIYSIELSEVLYTFCSEYFKDKKNVHVIFGDSQRVLWDIISKINTPITFWLDAHLTDALSAGDPIKPPLIEEIEIIGRHSIKNHTVLIDDLRCWGWNDLLMEKLSLVNPDYQFTIEDGTFEKDILVAQVR